MTDRIQQAFRGHKAFIPFLTCGDPDLAATAELVRTLDQNGADLIELGIPFSDPTAEGPVIQGANLRALSQGTTTARVLEMVAGLQGQVKAPLVFMTYANVVFSYGPQRFAAHCREAGVSGLILPDVPFEEKEEFAAPCREQGLALISMVAPTSGPERAAAIAREAEGFLYIVSSLGVTGQRGQFPPQLRQLAGAVRQASPVPCAIGFGVSSPQQAAQLAGLADGVIVGSALVELIGQYGRQAAPQVAAFAAGIRRALDGAGQ